MATLEHVETGQPFVPSSRAVVGRSPGAELVLADPRVSGEHATLLWDGVWQVRDLGSRNGTFLGDRRIAAGQQSPLALGDVLCFGGEGERWRVVDLTPPRDRLPHEALPNTVEAGLRVAELSLVVRVSSDQEYIEVCAGRMGDEQPLPPRAWFDVLWLLGRQRLSDVALPPAEQGWVYFDDLCRDLGRERQRVNVEIFRARQLLGDAGIVDAVDLFERRPTTRQIRLGVSRVQMHALG